MTSPEILIRLALLLALFIGLSLAYRRLLYKLIRFFPGRRELAGRLLVIPAVSLAVGTIWLTLFLYVYHGFDYQPDIYRRGSRETNKVAITFDDGPSPEFTPAILDILKEYDVQATFFMVGSHVEKYPEVARRVVEEGHTVGNHTYSHRNIPTLSTAELNYEILEATRTIFEVTGEYPAYVRPPRGMYDGRFRRLSHLLGQEIILWTVSSRDWRYGVSAQSIIRNVTSRVKGGDIILFHDSGALIRSEGGNRRATVEALPAVIEAIRNMGLEIVPLAELIHDFEPIELFPVVDMQE